MDGDSLIRTKTIALFVAIGLWAPVLTVNADSVVIPTVAYNNGTLNLLSSGYLSGNAIVTSADVNLGGYGLFVTVLGTLPSGTAQNASGGTMTDNYTVSLTGPNGQAIIAPQTFTDTVAGITVANYKVGGSYASPDPLVATVFSLDSATVPINADGMYSGYDLTVTVNSLIYTTSSGQQFAAGGLNSGTSGPGYASVAIQGITDVTYALGPPVPLPGAAWLMLSGLGGLAAWVRKR